MLNIDNKGLGIIQGLFVLFLLNFFGQTYAQVYPKINCLVPYEIEVGSLDSDQPVEEKIEFLEHDDHTFWYKISFPENAKISYSIESMDDQKNFDIYFYQYDGSNFCRTFIQGNLDLLSFEKNVEDFKVEKNSNYYLGIFPLFPGGCGHKIKIQTKESQYLLQARKKGASCTDREVVINTDKTDDKKGIVISGFVKDKESGNRINARITLIDPFTGHQRQLFAKEKEGFEANLLEDGDYKVKIQAFGYQDEITAISAYNGESYEFELQASDEKSFVLNNVYFYPNTYALKDESTEELESIYSYMNNHPNFHLLVIGHTNGSKDVKASRFVKENGKEWNFTGTAKELSLQRANKIKEFLTEKGIDQLRIKAEGKGGEEMIVKDPSNMKEAMKNIRVEAKVISQN